MKIGVNTRKKKTDYYVGSIYLPFITRQELRPIFAD